jgi:hypothetical protein
MAVLDTMFFTSFLMGGLGNQMFQIAKAKTEGFIRGKPVYFRPFSFIPMDGRQTFHYLGNVFRNIDFKMELGPVRRVCESSWAYGDVPYDDSAPVEFFGYFQSGKNFKDQKERIRELFAPTESFVQKMKDLYPAMWNADSVSIHVRRGDYLSISDVLPVVGKSYIDASLQSIGASGPIFIFTNDKEWVANHLRYENAIIVSGLEDYEDLWAMSLCGHNVMSNSSFSWWGAFLNANQNKKVCCPSTWFGPKGEKDFQDVYEKEWTLIETRFVNGEVVCV